ncbi:prenyltransferase/squalene oxidase repeat-containing protein [Rugosimonospora africana]|uniref:Prenyltransferase and squalene oxidase repeat-containing protein n=1 Tax=Rugosimonospora africana TaxID=556532 RepID=A0A8J3QN27_9ACTN|nr:prenyltransferase/squalene oxidase repeat-containing protein [Rugosimonospora africana]GIH12517.1 hypothetical protein Raf01_06890 [Rugosimonospora africana]
MVDIDAAVGYVVSHGDPVDRARLSWLRTGAPPPPDILERAESGQVADGGWPASRGGEVASIDATCFRLAELDDLGALDRPPARRALAWLASRQRPDGTWEEDALLADVAPPWARPGDPEARLYLTANAGFWLTVSGPIAPPPEGDTETERPGAPGTPGPGEPSGTLEWAAPEPGALEPSGYAEVVARATQAFRATMRDDGSWPSYLVAGWLGGAMLFHAGWFYESARIQVLLAGRVPEMSAADVALLAAAFRRVGMSPEDWLMVAARKWLAETQSGDGGWPSDDGPAFDVHTTLAAIRALR